MEKLFGCVIVLKTRWRENAMQKHPSLFMYNVEWGRGKMADFNIKNDLQTREAKHPPPSEAVKGHTCLEVECDLVLCIQ